MVSFPLWEPCERPKECEGCPRANVSSGFVPGVGDVDAELVGLAEEPGPRELEQGIPMVGPTGSEVRSGFGGTWDGVFRTNVRKCQGQEGENEAIRRASIAHCVAAYLQPELDALTGPKRLVCIGADALEVVTGQRGIIKLHGSTWSKEEVEYARSGR